MSYKNTVKAFATNFMLVWKQLLYMLVCIVIFALCAYSVSVPIINLFKNDGVGEEISSIFKMIYSSPSELLLKISDILKHVWSLIQNNFGQIYLNLIGLFFFGILFPFIFLQMSMFNLTSILYQKLSMNMNVKYMQNGIKTLKSSFLYAISNILFSLPFYALYVLAAVIYFQLANTTFSAILGLVILSAFILIIKSLKLSLFTCYTAHMAENGSNPMVAFGKGTTMVLKNFWKTISTSLMINLTLVFVESFIGVFTFLAGLIVIVPASYVFVSIYYLVVYFNSNGSRYYLGNNLIFNPVMYKVKKEEIDANQIEVPEEIGPNKKEGENSKKRKKT